MRIEVGITSVLADLTEAADLASVLADLTEADLIRVQGRCIRRHAQNASRNAMFHSSLLKESLSIAGIASSSTNQKGSEDL